MTHADVYCRILAETTGRPEQTFRAVLAKIPRGRRGRLDEQCPNAPSLLTELRAEKSGILNWLIEGAKQG
jgi:hypothetical protein